MREVTVRPAGEQDLVVIAAVMLANDRHYEWGGGNAAYVRHLMNHGSVLVAEMGAGVAGFDATQPVGAGPDVISMLCDLFVDPAAHGRGCGRALLSRLWAGSPRRMTFSSLHAHAIPLYTSFGLDAWWPLLELHGDQRRLGASADLTAEPADAAEVSRTELAWSGRDRSADHAAWAERPGGQGVVIRRDGELLGAGTVITRGPERGIEHLVVTPAANDSDAAAVVLHVLASLDGPADEMAHVSLPGPHPAVRPLLAAGWAFDDFDLFMATDPSFLDPRRAVVSPSQA